MCSTAGRVESPRGQTDVGGRSIAVRTDSPITKAAARSSSARDAGSCAPGGEDSRTCPEANRAPGRQGLHLREITPDAIHRTGEEPVSVASASHANRRAPGVPAQASAKIESTKI